jgi:hypothetical protein
MTKLQLAIVLSLSILMALSPVRSAENRNCGWVEIPAPDLRSGRWPISPIFRKSAGF